MKLYTEEQVRGAHIKGILKGRAGTTIPSGDLADLYISELTPIELPSDRDIEIAANGNQEHYEGAMWLKHKYLTKNTKQHIIDIMKADENDGLYNQNK